MLKGFRRRGKDNGETSQRSSHPRKRESKSEIATITPKRIIRALYDYKAQNDDELGFAQKEFLYVVDMSDPEWYVACNPLNNSSGLVPVSYFEVIPRQEAIATRPITEALHDPAILGHSRNESGLSNSTSIAGSETGSNSGWSRSQPPSHRESQPRSSVVSVPSAASQSRSHHINSGSYAQAIYGIVLYDFRAERNDELEAQAGESIILIAQSNEEWFVAKPIGRLGGPGLIPAAYVQLREVGTDVVIVDVQDAIRRAGVPQVEEWKRRAAEYKASSIPLGRFEEHSPATQAAAPRPQQSGQHHGVNGANNDLNRSLGAGGSEYDSSPSTARAGAVAPGAYSSAGPPAANSDLHVVRASVDRFAINGGRYWYLVVTEMSNGMFRNLCRYYQDFYDFQIKLLEEFPEEAGRTGKPRTLPFMPGPLTLVNHSISSQRRANLDEYVRNLIRMPPHISRSPLVQQLFALRGGDRETEVKSSLMPHPPDARGEHEYATDATDEAVFSANGSTVALNPTGSESVLGSDSQAPQSTQFSDRNTANPALASRGVASQSAPGHRVSASNGSATNGTSKHYHSASTASGPIPSHSAPNNAVAGEHIKVKVFYGEELIAIRIPATLQFSDLYQRVATRLGFEAPELHCRSDLGDAPITTDYEFRQALAGGNKLVMYARADSGNYGSL